MVWVIFYPNIASRNHNLIFCLEDEFNPKYLDIHTLTKIHLSKERKLAVTVPAFTWWMSKTKSVLPILNSSLSFVRREIEYCLGVQFDWQHTPKRRSSNLHDLLRTCLVSMQQIWPAVHSYMGLNTSAEEEEKEVPRRT